MKIPRLYSEILEAELELQNLKNDYLRSWGWRSTCETPGSYWLWRHPNVPIIGPMICSKETAISLTHAWNGLEGEWRKKNSLEALDD